MSKSIDKINLKAFTDKNRTNLDEALVSLRFMKQIDNFLHNNNLNQKNLAEDLCLSEAFVSQLMTGTKKINCSFINKFEKKYNLELKVTIESKNSKYTVIKVVDAPVELKFSSMNSYVKDIYCWNNISDNSFTLKTSNNLIEKVSK